MNNKIIISGNNLELTEALKADVITKAEKLFNHDDSIIRLRVELEYRPNKHHQGEFIAKGMIEIHGPDMIVSAASDDMYKSIDEMVIKLTRKLRRSHRLTKVKTKQRHDVDIPAVIPNMEK